MKYEKTVVLKNGRSLLLRNGAVSDAETVIDVFDRTHAETDFLLSYSDENSHTLEGEISFLREKEESDREIEILAVLEGTVVGTAGIEAVGTKYKVQHRTEFGISVLKEYWGQGIGRALMDACIECAVRTGYSQMELTAVAANERAVSLYASAGFEEYGRNPKGFRSRSTGYQEIVLMRLNLENYQTEDNPEKRK